MKKALPWILLALAIIAIVLLTRGHGAKVAEIMAQSNADIKVASAVIDDLQGDLLASRRREVASGERYEASRVKIESLETALSKRASNQAATPSAPAPPVIDWQFVYNDYFNMNQGYIASNQALRLEHDAMAEEHRMQAEAWKSIDLQRVSVIEGLTLARNRLAALHSPRWVVVFGGGVTWGEDKRLHYGLQLTAGMRVDDLFRKRSVL